MSFGTERPTITIEKVDGGFLVDWREPEPERLPQNDFASGIWPTPAKARPKTSGRQIVTDQKQLVKRVRDFFGIKP